MAANPTRVSDRASQTSQAQDPAESLVSPMGKLGGVGRGGGSPGGVVVRQVRPRPETGEKANQSTGERRNPARPPPFWHPNAPNVRGSVAHRPYQVLGR